MDLVKQTADNLALKTCSCFVVVSLETSNFMYFALPIPSVFAS